MKSYSGTGTRVEMLQSARSAHKIVNVISECRLIDSESHEHVYWRRNGLGLSAGYYVVTLPQEARQNGFGENAEFEGPFASLADAQRAIARAPDQAWLWTDSTPATAEAFIERSANQS